ncbi:methyl-accepting chemotaxis protein [Roseateles sp. P5_E1]
MNFNAFKVSTRLALGFGSAVLLGLVIAVFGMLRMGSLAAKVDELALDRMPKMDKFADIKDNLNTSARAVRNVLLTTDATVRAAEVKRIGEMRAATDESLAMLDKALAQPRSRALLKLITDNTPAYRHGLDQVLALASEGKTAEGAAMLTGEVRARQSTIFKAVDDSIELQSQVANQLAKDAGQVAASSGMEMLGGAVAMALLGGLVGWALSRSLSRALGAEPGELSDAVQRVADGDLAQPVPVRSGDTTSTVAAVARMQEALALIVSTVRANSDSVAIASAQIAQGNQDLSSRTEEQASALEQTAASMEQLGSAVQQNADNARQANQLAQGASEVAVRGGAVVNEVVATMRDIQQSSQRISDIIGTIDGIAFQTNILALNAAVEAARAGEQGRGFAVVAGEVRLLAQRSAQAAKEIKLLIMASVERVERGTVLVDQAGSTMTEVVDAIRRVTDLMGEISSASGEQSSGVAQVGEAVMQMDQTTQQNAALVEQGAAAAESLKEQARQLVAAVAVFRLAHEAHAVVPAPRPRKPSPPVSRPSTRPAVKAVVRRQAPVEPRVPSRPAAGPAVVKPPAAADGEWADF